MFRVIYETVVAPRYLGPSGMVTSSGFRGADERGGFDTREAAEEWASLALTATMQYRVEED